MQKTHLIVQCSLQKSLVTCIRMLSVSSALNGRRRPREYNVKGPRPDNVFAREEAENLDALEDFINQSGNSGHVRGHKLEQATEHLVHRHVVEEQRKIKKKILERKYFKPPVETNLLTWKAKDQIRYLHQEFPDEWTPETLANSFPVSVDGVRRILESSYRPRTEQELEKHDRRVADHWKHLKKTLALKEEPAQLKADSNNFKHVIDAGKLPLMINAGGTGQLPMPGLPMISDSKGSKKIGVFKTIVADSKLVKQLDEEKKAVKIRQNSVNQKLLRDIASYEQNDGEGDRKTQLSDTDNHRGGPR